MMKMKMIKKEDPAAGLLVYREEWEEERRDQGEAKGAALSISISIRVLRLE